MYRRLWRRLLNITWLSNLNFLFYFFPLFCCFCHLTTVQILTCILSILRYCFVCSFVRSSIISFVHPFIHSFFGSLVCPSVHPPIHSSIPMDGWINGWIDRCIDRSIHLSNHPYILSEATFVCKLNWNEIGSKKISLLLNGTKANT